MGLNIMPAYPLPNLDVLARLYDAGWNEIAISDPPSDVSAVISADSAEGVYYITVEGTGSGDPFSPSPTGYTGYDSLGQYTISGTALSLTGAWSHVALPLAPNQWPAPAAAPD